MPEPDERRTWTQLRRFEFLEWKMFWEDRVIRSDLEGAFGISTPQASVDLRHYRDIAADNMEATARGYRPSATFRPRFLVASADRLLLQLRAFLSGVIPEIWFKEIPPVEVIPDVARSVAPEHLRRLLMAIRERQALDVRYHALSGGRTRAIAPHALAFDGHRWHVRAYCCEKEDFRDFVLSRIDQIGEFRPATFDPADDVEWQTKVTLCLRPHRDLRPEESHAIALDYGMKDGKRELELRASLAFYFIRRMNLDLKVTDTLTPQRLQIELENFDEVTAQIAAARAASEVLVSARRNFAVGTEEAH